MIDRLIASIEYREVNALAAISLLVLYWVLYNISGRKDKREAWFFGLISIGWFINLVYLVIGFAFDSKVFEGSELVSETVDMSLNLVGSVFFLFACRLKLQHLLPSLLSKRSIVMTSVIVGLLIVFRFLMPSLATFGDLASVAVGSIAIIAVAFSYQVFFQERSQNYSNWVKLPIVLSMYSYGVIQWGIFLPQSSPSMLGFASWQGTLFMLGTMFKGIHIFGLVTYTKSFLYDYDHKRQTFDNAKLQLNLFDQIKHELATPLAEFSLRWKRIESSTQFQSVASEKERMMLSDLIEQITGMLTAFRRHQLFIEDANATGQFSLFNLNNLIDSVILSLKITLKPKAKIERQYASRPLVFGRESDFYQIIRNLLKNALEATQLRPDGRIIVSTTVMQTEQQCDGVVVLTITDNGGGIFEDMESRIFEDGFTTKQGEGRGHGLYIVQFLVSKYSGLVSFTNKSSQFGFGACFEVEFKQAAATSDNVEKTQ